MNGDDFQTWLGYHIDAFPGLGEWLEKPDRRDHKEKILLHWFRAMSNVCLADAKLATDAIFCGDAEKPEGWSDHPRKIRRICANLHASRGSETRQLTRFYDGAPAYSCPVCEDLLNVTVWHPEVYDLIRAAIIEGLPADVARHRRTCNVTCHCEAGLRLAATSRRKLVTYDSSRMVPCYSRHDGESFAVLVERLMRSIERAGIAIPEPVAAPPESAEPEPQYLPPPSPAPVLAQAVAAVASAPKTFASEPGPFDADPTDDPDFPF